MTFFFQWKNRNVDGSQASLPEGQTLRRNEKLSLYLHTVCSLSTDSTTQVISTCSRDQSFPSHVWSPSKITTKPTALVLDRLTNNIWKDGSSYIMVAGDVDCTKQRAGTEWLRQIEAHLGKAWPRHQQRKNVVFHAHFQAIVKGTHVALDNQNKPLVYKYKEMIKEIR